MLNMCIFPLWVTGNALITQHSRVTEIKLLREMSTPCFFLLSFFILHISGSNATPTKTGITRSDFPPEFIFGAGTSAYQVEGAAAEDGRKPSIWDTYTHLEYMIQQGTGDVASDQYHKNKDDVKLMYKMGLDAYRFSISWSRLIPDGHGAVNPKGLQYYNNLLDELVSHGIEAHVTLSHFDFPQALQDEYEGPQSRKFIEDFTAYADICFKEFGDRVKYWMTFNEPNTAAGFTRCFLPEDLNCSSEISDTKRYHGGLNVLLSHAAAVHLYRTKYQETQNGKIGITLLGVWLEPLTNSALDIDAAKQEIALQLGWFLDPLVYGHYPAILKNTIGSVLPNITEENARQITSSYDFIGINNYYGQYVQNSISFKKNSLVNTPRVLRDFATKLKDTQYLVPGLSLQKLLEYIKQNYKNPMVLVHENGFPTSDDDSADPALQNDTNRIQFIESHLQTLFQSIRNGSNVRGYFVWSFLDVYELFGFFKLHFGLYGVDFNDENRRRYPRQSAHWYTAFLAKTRKNLETPSHLHMTGG